MWWQPILADEVDFYRSMINWPVNRALIPHPQAYIHLAQLSMTLFGANIGAMRIVGVVSALMSLWLIPVMVHIFWRGRPDGQRITILAVMLIALSPMTLQNAMLLDIDNTLLIPAILVLVCVWGARPGRSIRLRVLWLSLALAGALWVKLPTPPMIMAALCAYHLARREWSRAAEIVVASLVGLGMFAVSFGIYSQLTGFDGAYFAPTFGRTAVFFIIPELLARFPQGLGVFALWLSIPLAILSLGALLTSLRRFRDSQTQPADALMLCAVAVTAFYTLFYIPAWGYPRYESPIVPLLMVVVAGMVAPYTVSVSRRGVLWLTLLVAGLFSFNLWRLPDPLYPIYSVTFDGGLFDLRHRLLTGLGVVVELGIPLALMLAAGWIVAHVRQYSVSIIGVLLIVVACLAGLASLDFTQVAADYSTRYRYTYNYADYAWTVRTVQAAGPTAYILAIKDVLFESRLAGAEVYDYLCPTCSARLVTAVHARKIDALVWTTKEENRSSDVATDPNLRAALLICYDRLTRGVFIVYMSRADLVCP